MTSPPNTASKNPGKKVREYYFVDKSTGELIFYYVPAPAIVLYNKELSDGAFRLFGVLCDYDGSNGECYPSVATLAADLGKSESQICRLIKELVKEELVTITEEAGRSNHYNLERYGTQPKAAGQVAALTRGAINPGANSLRPGANLTPLPHAKMDDELKELKLKNIVCRTVQNSSNNFGLSGLDNTDLTQQAHYKHFEEETTPSTPSCTILTTTNSNTTTPAAYADDNAISPLILEANSATSGEENDHEPNSSKTDSSFTQSATLSSLTNQDREAAKKLVELTTAEQLKVAELLAQAKIGWRDVQELALKNDLETVQTAITISQSPYINSPTGYIVSALRRGYVQRFREDNLGRVKAGSGVTNQANNHPSQTPCAPAQVTKKPNRPRQQPVGVGRSPYITNVMADFSLALHDIDHTRSNQGQANRIYTQCGLEEKKFVELMYEAKKRTQWAALAATSSDSSGATNRGAYFFTVLRELVAEKQASKQPF